MDLRLSPVSAASAARNLAPTRTVAPAAEGGFSSVLSGALSSVSTAQAESGRMQREVQMENPQVSLEQTMVSMQKAQIGFQAALHVRNRMVQAYTDIMNMQV